MTELLVLIACMNGQGCTQTSSAYYIAHPEFRQTIKHNETKVKDIAGPEFVAIMPAAAALIKKRASFKITKHVSLEYDLRSPQDNRTMLVLTF